MQNVAFNLQPLVSGDLTGIGQYTWHIMQELLPTMKPDSAIWHPEYHVSDALARHHADRQLVQLFDGQIGRASIHVNRLLPFGAYVRGGRALGLLDYQHLFRSQATTTVFFNFIRPACLQGKSIITLYDMVYHRYPETMTARNRHLLERQLPRSAGQAEAIVTISHAVKAEIMEYLGIPADKIHVAHCGVDRSVFFPIPDDLAGEKEGRYIRRKYNLPSAYLLYLGTLEPRKNVVRLVEAFERLAPEHPDLGLVLAGGKGWGFEPVLQKIARSPYKQRIILPGFVDENDKPALYRQAEVFVFPSLYEGFGLPPLEALACGTPVITSNTSSLPEIVGRAGITIDPLNTEALAGKIHEILASPAIRSHQLDQRLTQAARFTWQNAGKVYADLIRFMEL